MQDIVKKDITAILTPSMIDDDKCELFAKNLLALAPEGEFDEKVVVSLVKKANEGNGSFINKFKEIIADSDYWELNDDKYISFVKKALEGKEYTTVFDNAAKRNLEEQYNSVIKPLFARLGILQESINSTFGRRTESLSTLTYKDVSNKIIKGLNLSSAEITRSKDNLEEAMNIAIEKLATKAKNPDEFMSYLASVATEQNKYSEKITSSLLKIQGKGFDTVFEDGVGSIEDGAFKNVMDFVQNLGDDFKHTKSFFTLGGNRNSLIAHFKNTIDKALANTDACFARFILASDFERRCASDKAFVEKLVSLAPDSFEDKEKTVISWCRKILLDDTMTDFSNKNNIPFKKLYDGLMESLFDPEKLTDETKKVLKDNNLLNRVKKSILNMKDVALNLKSREFDYLGGNARYMVPQGLQYNMMGKPISELFQESSKQLFNNKKWFKIFAPAFGVLAGVTVLSQFFFGKMKDEHLYKKQEGVNNVSGK